MWIDTVRACGSSSKNNRRTLSSTTRYVSFCSLYPPLQGTSHFVHFILHYKVRLILFTLSSTARYVSFCSLYPPLQGTSHFVHFILHYKVRLILFTFILHYKVRLILFALSSTTRYVSFCSLYPPLQGTSHFVCFSVF